MKKGFVLAYLICWASLIFCSFGCSVKQPGETLAEGHRRHIRNMRVNQQELIQDVDTTLLLDEPSELTDKHVP